MADTNLLAGIAKCKITSKEQGVSILDPMYVKALVLDDGETKVVIITMDVTAIGGRKISDGMLPDVGEGFLPELRGRIEKELDISGTNILVSASHTHPPGRMLCNDDEQVKRTFDAVKRATQNMVEVKIGSGSGYDDRLTMNRTVKLKNGRAWTIRNTNPSPADKDVAELGPIDPEIGVIRIDRLDGGIMAVLYNFACHPLSGDIKGHITANFPGVASRIIEENYAGAMAFFLQGAAGDIIDLDFKNFVRPREVESMGIKLGLNILGVLRKITPQAASLKIIQGTIDLPRRVDIQERINELRHEQDKLLHSLVGTSLNFKNFLLLYLSHALNPDYPLSDAYRYLKDRQIGCDDFESMDAYNKKNIDKYLANIGSMEKLARIQDKITTLEKHQVINAESGNNIIKAEMLCIKIGDCILITSPTEMLTEVGLNIKKSSPYEKTFVVGFSNGYMHYGPPADDYDSGGYEVTECLLAPEWQEILEDKAAEMISDL
jgi:hypothetical protein